MTLDEMIKIYNDCPSLYGDSACKDCPLCKPVHEQSEHPTFCEVISDLDMNN
jgi:hypothetical protein